MAKAAWESRGLMHPPFFFLLLLLSFLSRGFHGSPDGRGGLSPIYPAASSAPEGGPCNILEEIYYFKINYLITIVI